MTEAADAAKAGASWFRADGLGKSYFGSPALRHATIEFRAGAVHGLIGANGAGKSTFIKILAGTVQPDQGTLEIDGQLVTIPNPQAARAFGLGFVHQELNLIPQFSIAKNLSLGQWPRFRVPHVVDRHVIEARAREIMAIVGYSGPVQAPVESLSVADQWLVCIGRALMHDARFIAMDEPTASMSHTEAARLFEIVRSLRSRGISLLYVSHRLDEILDLCDQVTTFRDGTSVSTVEGQRLTKDHLVRSILNQELPEGTVPHDAAQQAPERRAQRSVTAGPPVLQVDRLSDGQLADVSFSVASGEIVGIAGLVGSGRSHLLRLIFGVHRPRSGRLILDGQPLDLRSPFDARKRGIGLIPEERRRQGLVMDGSIALNLRLASLGDASPVRGWPLYSARKANGLGRLVAGRLKVKYEDVRDPVATLSGGNQQKVVFGRWISDRLRLLLLDEPTRGVDVGARREIHGVSRGIAANGAAVIMVSSEFEELLNCDRVLVLREGRLVGELTGDRVTESNMTALCFGEDVA
ncbi:MAG: sugar ABC transporter ATP-binding protein [Actinomycetota bacterium]|nr:sugar ABC transporter ATP-binding protein [Actinomycetota bacterium]